MTPSQMQSLMFERGYTHVGFDVFRTEVQAWLQKMQESAMTDAEKECFLTVRGGKAFILVGNPLRGELPLHTEDIA